MSQTFDLRHRRAKQLESKLEISVQRYAVLAQKMNADFLCDEENSLLGPEALIVTEIERDLSELAECISSMRLAVNTGNGASSASGTSGGGGAAASLQHHQESLIKRYHEIHFDFAEEFKNISVTVHRKRESMELFQSSKNLHMGEQDSSVAKLLRERSSIAASMKSINDVIAQAFDTKSALANQRGSLAGAASGLSGLASNVPTFNRLIDGIQRKKTRESVIVAVFIGMLLCLTIWWIFMR